MIRDLNVDCLTSLVRPLKANPPLIVDANAVLPCTIALERLEPVPWWRSKVETLVSRIESIQYYNGTCDGGARRLEWARRASAWRWRRRRDQSRWTCCRATGQTSTRRRCRGEAGSSRAASRRRRVTDGDRSEQGAAPGQERTGRGEGGSTRDTRAIGPPSSQHPEHVTGPIGQRRVVHARGRRGRRGPAPSGTGAPTGGARAAARRPSAVHRAGVAHARHRPPTAG
jgi:hypothetical protein